MKSKLKSLAFFKDLGGIKTSDGSYVKEGIIFRSSEMSKMSKEDSEVIEPLHACIDLRTEEEISIAPDYLKEDERYHHIALLSNEDNPAVTRKTRTPILKKRAKEEGGMKGHLVEIYRKIISDPFSIEGTREIFKLLIDNPEEEKIVFHCTQGKDRTGLVSASILMALGVDKEDIINDYLGFNKFQRMRRFWIFIGISIVFFSVRYAKELDTALTASRDFIDVAFQEIEKGWGTIKNYLSKAIGLTDDDISTLRKLYLVKE